MTGLLVAVVMLLFVCVPPSAPWADTAPGLQNRVAQADNSQIVPPDPEQSAEAPVASSAAEVLRLRDLIGEKRDEIEAGRSAALEQVEATYRADLAAIEPKDMFETELEYQQRDAREKSEVELQRARDVSDVHREHDLALRDEVEPMVQQVRELLSRDDIVPAGAIDSNLENYDAERKVFTGTLKIDSVLVQMNAQFYLPMKRDKARVLWQSRTTLQGKVRVSMNVRSLDIGIEKFWLEDPESGSRTEERVAVVEIRHPGARATSEEHLKVATRFVASASALAERVAGRNIDWRHPNRPGKNEASGWVAEYNRLIEEAQSVFTSNPHIQALRPLRFLGINSAHGAVTAAAWGLETYLTSFRSDQAFGKSASSLAQRVAGRDINPVSINRAGKSEARGWVAEYNRLIEEAQSVFTKNPHIQALRPLQFLGINGAHGAVTAATWGLETYLTSFRSDQAFRKSASALAERVAGRSINPWNSNRAGKNEASGWVAEYNRLIEEARSVFTKNPHIQALRPLRFLGINDAHGAVTAAAWGLETYLTSFRSDQAFRKSASALAERVAGRNIDRHHPNRPGKNEASGWVAEYNRLIEEAQSVFTSNPHIQALRPLRFLGINSAHSGVIAAAEKLARIMATIKEPLRKPAAEAVAAVTAPAYTLLDHLPYSGRFSQDAHKLAKLLGRGFSPDARDENGLTDLHYAALLNLPGLAAALLDAGADNGVKLKSDSKDYSNRVRGTLFGFGHDLAGSRRRGQTPLHYAAWFNARSVAAVLIAGGTEVNVQTNSGYTPIHYAALHNSHAVTELLIGQGADIRAKTENGWTPLDTAIEAEAAEAEALLRRHEAPCNKKCS